MIERFQFEDMIPMIQFIGSAHMIIIFQKLLSKVKKHASRLCPSRNSETVCLLYAAEHRKKLGYIVNQKAGMKRSSRKFLHGDCRRDS